MTAPPHLLSEYEDVQPIHRRILAFSFIGWIFDFYDLLLLSFVVASTSLTKDLALSAYDVSVLLGTALESPGARAFQASGGRLRPQPVACSNAYASCRTPRSSPRRPAIWTPTGRPSAVKPAGTEIAGSNVALIQYADFIHAM